MIEIPTVEGWLSGLRQRSCFGFGHPGLFHRVSISSGLKHAHNRVAAFELFTVHLHRTSRVWVLNSLRVPTHVRHLTGDKTADATIMGTAMAASSFRVVRAS